MQTIKLAHPPRLQRTNRYDYMGRTIWNNDTLYIGELIVRVDDCITREGATCHVEAMAHAAPGGYHNPMFGENVLLEWSES